MALIECPECGKQISENADSCPNCGNPMKIRSRQEHKPQRVEVRAKEGCFLQTLNAGCMIIFIIIALLVLAILFG